MTPLQLQTTLTDLGYACGPIDGVMGPLTRQAIKLFQADHDLTVDGIVGKRTLSQLHKRVAQAPASDSQTLTQSDDSIHDLIPLALPWLHCAHHLIGTQEVSGTGSNPTIMQWANYQQMPYYTDDDIPWCGLFVAHCVSSQLTNEPLPSMPLRARAWRTFGQQCTPQLGAIMVFWRESIESNKGHVGFYWSEDDDTYHILGGNQSNSVTVAKLAKSRLLCARWPITSLTASSQVVIAKRGDDPISQNEA
ncbi:NlpC/P60 family protein [Vibrio ulleungensis]|uniref:TIGR02594 family protein n=1 Tax=Vibrio ulleungensis TaxID=2807619 RepID=A0ABS2HGX3_9VIBR|nr:TIGR02594 family protein [Vibrio ulleungensis]MBM7036765.1 TIGR02594 family protein [Vibrio ulleungensis]